MKAMIDTCDDNHEQVAYTDSDCPVCIVREEMQEELDDLAKKYEDAVQEGEDYLVDIGKLEQQLEQFSTLKDRLEGMVNDRL